MKLLLEESEGIKKQLSKFLDFQSTKKNRAIMVNNYDWMERIFIPRVHPLISGNISP